MTWWTPRREQKKRVRLQRLYTLDVDGIRVIENNLLLPHGPSHEQWRPVASALLREEIEFMFQSLCGERAWARVENAVWQRRNYSARHWQRETYKLDGAFRRRELERGAKYREANKKEIAVRDRRYRVLNQDKLNEKSRQYRACNADKLRAQDRARYEADKEARRARARQYYEANKEKLLEQKRQRRALQRARGEKVT